MKNRISRYHDDVVTDESYSSPSIRQNNITTAQKEGLVEKATDSIAALAKQKPVAVVVVGVAAGLVIGWLTRRNA